MSIVAVIPARGGSKGIPRKNIIDFCGKPLIAWSIEQALNAEGVDGVWVTSDSEEILDVSVKHGAIPIKRPETIAGDAATSESAWLHALEVIEGQGISVEAMIGMQATSPVRESKDLENGVMTFRSSACDSLFSASPLGDFFIWEKKKDASYASVNYDYENRKRRQDVAEQYVENGSFYIFQPELLRKKNNRLGGKIDVSVMEFWKAFEVNDMNDLKLCEVLMKAYLPVE